MERLEQEGPPPHRRRHRHPDSLDDRHRGWRPAEDVAGNRRLSRAALRAAARLKAQTLRNLPSRLALPTLLPSADPRSESLGTTPSRRALHLPTQEIDLGVAIFDAQEAFEPPPKNE